MYETKQFINAHGQITVVCEFTTHKGVKYKELGFSQSYNIKREKKIVISDAIYNAFYRLSYHLHIDTYGKTGEDIINKYFKKVEVKNWSIRYYEDRIYSYKREVYNGKYYIVKRRKGIIEARDPWTNKKRDFETEEEIVFK